MSYPVVADHSFAAPGWVKDTTPAPDVATKVPTTGDGGITDGGKVYTFHLRKGVDWNTKPARQVTAADFVREFKAFCNPAPGGFVGNLSYYAATIAGMRMYCKAEEAFFNKPKHHVTAANVARFQNTHGISGIIALNPLTIRFRLLRPAGDFLYFQPSARSAYDLRWPVPDHLVCAGQVDRPEKESGLASVSRSDQASIRQQDLRHHRHHLHLDRNQRSEAWPV